MHSSRRLYPVMAGEIRCVQEGATLAGGAAPAPLALPRARKEGVRSTCLHGKAAHRRLLRASPTGRVWPGQGARLHRSQPCRWGRCVSSHRPGSCCLPCGCGSPTTLPGCNRDTALRADPDSHLPPLLTTHPADKLASKQSFLFCKPLWQPSHSPWEHGLIFEELHFPSPSRDLLVPPVKRH